MIPYPKATVNKPASALVCAALATEQQGATQPEAACTELSRGLKGNSGV